MGIAGNPPFVSIYWALVNQSDLPFFEKYSLLTVQDRESAGRFSDTGGRLLHMAGRALLHHALQKDMVLAANSYQFQKTETGQPIVVDKGAAKQLPVHITVAHTKGCAVAGVSSCGPIGVDLESRDRKLNWQEIADAKFSLDEAAKLRALDAEEGRLTFLKAWTVKESLGKFSGKGVLPMLGKVVPSPENDASFFSDISDLGSVGLLTQILNGAYIMSAAWQTQGVNGPEITPNIEAVEFH